MATRKVQSNPSDAEHASVIAQLAQAVTDIHRLVKLIREQQLDNSEKLDAILYKPRKGNTRITPEICTAADALFAAGATCSDVAAKLNISKTAAHYVRHKALSYRVPPLQAPKP